MRRRTLLPALSLPALLAGGCVERTISITSDPPGALVWLNDREVGRTPVEVGFVHYGTYDVRLSKEGYEPLMTSGEAKPPLWDNVPLDFFAEFVPGAKSRIAWHYELGPREDDPARLIERARELRDEAVGKEPEPASSEAAATAGEADGA